MVNAVPLMVRQLHRYLQQIYAIEEELLLFPEQAHGAGRAQDREQGQLLLHAQRPNWRLADAALPMSRREIRNLQALFYAAQGLLRL